MKTKHRGRLLRCPPPQPGPAYSHGDHWVCVFPGCFHRYIDVVTSGLLTHGWPPSLPHQSGCSVTGGLLGPSAAASDECVVWTPRGCADRSRQLDPGPPRGSAWCWDSCTFGVRPLERCLGQRSGTAHRIRLSPDTPRMVVRSRGVGAAGSPGGRPALAEPLPEPGLGVTAPWAVFLEPRCLQQPGSHSVFEKGASPAPPGAALMGSTGRAAGSLMQRGFLSLFQFFKFILN